MKELLQSVGARGKVLVVVPDHNLVVVTMGETPQEQSGNYLARIVDAVLSIFPR